MTRREFGQCLAAGAAAAVLPRGALAEGWRGYGDAVAFDACGGPGDPDSEDDLAPLSPGAVEDARRSGLTAVSVTLAAGGTFEETIRALSACERELDAHPDAFLKVKRAADLRAARQERRVGLVYALQDLSMIGEDLSRIDVLQRLGVRIVQPTYNLRNVFGDGCLEPGNAGLSRLGHAALRKVESLRMVLDLSHCGPRTTAEALAAATRPVAITHTGCAAVHGHPRNKTDAELKGCAERGGVIGIYFMPYLRAKGPPTADDVLRHLEHAIQVCGEDHVGIGTDGTISGVVVTEKLRQTHRAQVQKRRQAGIGAPGEDEEVFNFVPELNTPRRFEVLGGLLLARGHSEARVAKILGGNFARLFTEVVG